MFSSVVGSFLAKDKYKLSRLRKSITQEAQTKSKRDNKYKH